MAPCKGRNTAERCNVIFGTGTGYVICGFLLRDENYFKAKKSIFVVGN